MCRSFWRDLSCPQSAMLASQFSRYSKMCAPHNNNWKWSSVTTTTFQKQRFTATIWSRLRTWCSDIQQRENHVVFMWGEMKTPLSFCRSMLHQHVRKNHAWGRFPRMRTNLYCRTRHCSTSESTFPRPWSKSSLYGRTDPRVCTSFLPPSIPPLLCSYPSHGSNVTRHRWTARNNADHFQIPTTTKRSCYIYLISLPHKGAQ